MKILWAEIKNFRSIIQTSFVINSGVNAFVGGNESGKSNVMLALERFLNIENFIDDDVYQLSEEAPEITIKFGNFTQGEQEKIASFFGIPNISEVTIKRVNNDYIPFEPSMPLAPIIEATDQSETNTDFTVNTEKPIKSMEDRFRDEVLYCIPDPVKISAVDDLIVGDPILINDLYLPDEEFEKPELASKKYLRTVRSLLEIGGLTHKEIQEPDLSKRLSKIERGAAIISKKLNDSWQQEDIKIRIAADTEKLVIQFRDGKNIAPNEINDPTRWIWTLPQNRSHGFRWYITFYARYLKEMQNNRSSVFLIDDIGAPLNKKAQEDLLNEFRKLALNNSTQILYVTHSKDMVDWDTRKDIFCIIKEGGKGTKVEQLWWERFSRNELPAPLDELGVTWITDFLREENLIVEGITDVFILDDLSRIFVDHINSEPFKGYRVIQGGGWEAAINMAKLCKAHNRKSFLVFDSDSAGLIAKTKATDDSHQLIADDVKNLTLPTTYTVISIEDLLPRKEFIESLNVIGKEKLLNTWEDITNLRGIDKDGIIESIKKRLVREGMQTQQASDFIRNYKYNIIKRTLSIISLDSFTKEDQKIAVINFFNNLHSKL